MVDKKQTVKKNDNKPIESKSDKFKRLGTSRLKNVVNSLRLLGNCGNSSNYQFNQEQVDYIFEMVYEKVAKCQNKFIPKEQIAEQEKIKL